MGRLAHRAAPLAALILATIALFDGARAADAKAAFRALDEFVKANSLTAEGGLFPIYRNPQNGETYIGVRADQLGKEFIHFSYVESGAVDAAGGGGLSRGMRLDNIVIKIERRFDALQIVQEDTDRYFDPASPLARAQDANAPPLILAAADIRAATPGNKMYLVSAARLLPPESFGRAAPTITEIRNHPANTDLLADYVITSRTGDITVRVQHSFIELRDSDYKPRAYDYRVGYFTEQRDDLTSPEPAPYKDDIHRWNLQKKDPAAAISEPVKPIVFWIEDTTPHEFRDAVKRGVLAWNKAFEAAGFRNAIEVRDQPHSADCRVGDIRCNVIRWVSSPGVAYRGSTPSFTDPRTGEIISANVMLDYNNIMRGVRSYQSLVTAGGPPATTENAGADLLGNKRACCAYDQFVQHNYQFGVAALAATGATPADLARLADQTVQWTVMHEVGHALGLRHNFKASTIRPLNELQATDAAKFPLTGSVMDYVPVNIARKGERQGNFFPTEIGPYDIWAIQFGYSPSLADPAAEAKRQNALLLRSTEPQLAFGDDADWDSFSDDADGAPVDEDPLASIDPRDAKWDLSADPVAWARDRMILADQTLAGLKGKYIKAGQSYQALYDAYAALMNQKIRAAATLARAIGGIYIEQSMPDQPGAKPPFTPVPLATQKAAMDGLARYVFAPDAFAVSADLVSYLQAQPRGYGSPDPAFHAGVITIQRRILYRLLESGVMRRLTDTRLYGNLYTVKDELDDLTNAIFAADADGEINTFRRNLQAEYVQLLIGMIGPDGSADAIANAAVLSELQRISGLTAPRLFFPKTAETEAHRAYIHRLIDVAFKEDQ